MNYVIVYEIATNKVTNIIGKNMRRSGTYNSAETRLTTISARLNSSYSAEIVPAGTYKVGSIRS